MKQRHLLLLFLTMLLPLGTWADEWDTFEFNGIRYEKEQKKYSMKDGTWVLTGYTVSVGGRIGEGPAISTETNGIVTIPETVNSPDGLPCKIDYIASKAFENCKYITSVIFPSTIEGIGSASFRGCESLESINFPDALKGIDINAFDGCTSLVSLTIPSSVTNIGYGIVQGCSALTSLIVENGNTSYDSRDNCNAIINTTTGNLIAGCKNTTIPDGITIIESYAFSGCTGLTSINIPSSVTKIGGNAFYGCKGLTQIIIPNSVTTIGGAAFQRCEALKSVTLPNALEKIEAFTFLRCYNLSSISIPTTVISIGEDAFNNCKAIESIVIPKSVTKIEYNSFWNMESLKSITVESGNTAYDSREKCNAIINTATNELVAGCMNTVIPNTVTAIGYGAFIGSGLTSIIVPNSVTTIGRAAFEDCTSLTSILLSDNLTEIGNEVFLRCSSIESIDIPENVTKIDLKAFYECTALKTLVIPAKVSEINGLAFYGLKSLTEITSLIEEPFNLPSNVFSGDTYNNVPLYVPFGTKAKYLSTTCWSKFKNIKEIGEIEPIDGETSINTDGLENKDLTNNVINGVYYNVGNHAYDSADKSIVISETTNMEQITNAVPGSDDVKNNFTGIILKVAAGKGIIKVNVKTSGNAQLVVQVGNATPMIASKTEQGDVVVSYDVEEDTYVYIYAIIGSSASPSMRASSTDEVRIYGFTVSPGASGVKAVWANEDSKAQIFSLDGKPLNEPQKGVNIVRMSNGQVRKVVVK